MLLMWKTLSQQALNSKFQPPSVLITAQPVNYEAVSTALYLH